MPRPARLFAVLLGLASIALPLMTRAADPSASSDALIALRAEPQSELRIVYRKDAGGKSETVMIGLAADYDYVDLGSVRTIHDYKLRRVLTVGPGGSFVNNSLYALVWHRVAELQNRARMRKMLEAAKVDAAKVPSTTDPFWIETELGLVNPSLPRPEIVRREEGGRSIWRVGRDDVAAVKFKAEPVPEAVRPGLRRLWPALLALHPVIADALTASAHLPEELTLQAMSSPAGVKQEERWTLTAVEWVSGASYPLARGLMAEPAEKRGSFPEIFHILSAYVAEKRAPPPEALYIGRVRDAIGRGAGLEAMLWLLEMQLAAGTQADCRQAPNPDPFCQLAPQAGPLAKADPRFALTFGAQAPGEADRHKFDDLPNAYLTRVLFATKPHPQDVTAAENEAGLLSGIKAAPIANFCKDAGDFYLQNWNPAAAWQVMDLGRQMAGHHAGDLLSSLDEVEARLVTAAPSLF